MLTWKTCAQLAIMTEAEKQAFFAHEVPLPDLLRIVIQDYARPNSLRRYPALNSSIVDDIELAMNTGRYEFSALLKAGLQRRILDAFKGQFLMSAGISPLEIRIHPNAETRGLSLGQSDVWHKMVQELYKERAWPWDASKNQSNQKLAHSTSQSLTQGK